MKKQDQGRSAAHAPAEAGQDLGVEERYFVARRREAEHRKRTVVRGGVAIWIMAILALWGFELMSHFTYPRHTDFFLPAYITLISAGFFVFLRYFHGHYDVYVPLIAKNPEKCACGYDLRGTPLRCPECGTDTPFKKWLDDHPLDKAIYEKRLTPRAQLGGKRDQPSS